MNNKQLILLAMPVIISGFFQPLLALTDAVIIGSIEGHSAEALAAVTLGGSLITGLFWLFGNVKSASIAIISKYVSDKPSNEVLSVLVGRLLLFSIFLGVLVGLLAVGLSPLLDWYQLDPEVSRAVEAYTLIRLYGMPFSIGVLVLFGLLYALEKPSFCTKLVFLGGLTNAILSYYLVHSRQPTDIITSAQRIAIGSTVSDIMVFFVTLWHVHRRVIPLYFQKHEVLRSEMMSFLVLNANLALRALSITFVFQVCNFLASRQGNGAIAVQSILLNLFLISAFTIDGVSSPVLMTAGKYYAQQSYDKVKSYYVAVKKLALKVSFGIMIIYAILYYPIPYLFGNLDGLSNYFYQLFWILIVIQPIGSRVYCFDSLFKSLGKAKKLRNIVIISSLLIFPLITFVAYYGFDGGMYAVWAGFFGWVVARYVFSLIEERRLFDRWLR